MDLDKRQKKRIFTLIRIAVSGGLIVFLLTYLDLGDILTIVTRIWSDHPFYLLGIVLGAFLFQVCEAYRLQQVLLIQDIFLPLPRLTAYCFIGMFCNNFMPTTIGGDVAKGFYIARDSSTKTEPFIALLVTRLIGAFWLTVITAVALLIGYRLLPDKTTPTIMVIGLVSAIGFSIIFLTRRKLAVKFLILLKPFKSKRLRKEVIAVYRLFHSHKHRPGRIALASLATLGIEFLFIFFNFMVARGLGYENISFIACLIYVPLIAVATLVPSLNGLGVREAAYIYFFGPVIGEDGAGALSLLMLATVIFLGLVGGVVFAVTGSARKARPRLPEAEAFDIGEP